MNEKIVIIAPHPDDETIACAGTILDRLQHGISVHIVLMTDGRHSHSACFGILKSPSPKEIAKIRAHEFNRVVAFLGVAAENITTFGFPDAALENHLSEATIAMQQVLMQKEQSITEIFYPSAYDTHPDHRAAYRITNNALATLPTRPKRHCYTIWNGNPALLPPPDLEIDISLHLATKQQAISMYTSQVDRITPQQPTSVLTSALLAPILSNPVEYFWTDRDEPEREITPELPLQPR